MVLVNWNLADDTLATARSVLASGDISPILVVVDNGSADDSVERLRAALPEVCVLSATANRGYAAGANIGLRWVLEQDCEYALLLNNDVEPDPPCIAHLIEALEQRPGDGIAAFSRTQVEGTCSNSCSSSD